MKKHVFIAVAILVSVLSASAQDNLFENDEHPAYKLGKTTMVQRLNAFGKVLEEKPFPDYTYGKFPIGRAIREICHIGRKYYFLYYAYNKESKLWDIMQSEIKADLTVTEPKLIFTRKLMILSPKPDEYDAYFASRPNWLGHFYCYNTLEETNEQIHFTVFDEDFVPKWDKKFELPMLDRTTRMGDFQLSVRGDFVASSAFIKNSGEKYLGMLEKKRHFAFSRNGFSEVALSPGENKATLDNNIKLDSLSNIFIVGIYLDTFSDKTNHKITGYYSGYFNTTTNRFEKKIEKKFDSEFTNLIAPEGDYDKKIVRTIYSIPNITVMEDGTIRFTVQRKYSEYKLTGASPGGYSEVQSIGNTISVTLNAALQPQKIEKAF